MKKLELTLFSPVPLEDGKYTILYKSIKDFVKNPDNTISFNTVIEGVPTEVQSSLHWRMKTTEVADTATETPAPAVSGNRSRARQY